MGFFGRDRGRPRPEGLESVIGPSASLTGHLRSDGGVRLDGMFEGVIEVAGNVVVGEGARVVADISARNVTVGGAVRGNIDAAGRLEILSSGQVIGDIVVDQVMIDDGGLFQGTSRMRGIEQRALNPPLEDAGAPAPRTSQVREAHAAVEALARPAPDVPDESGQARDEDDDFVPIIPDVVIEDIPADDDEGQAAKPPTSQKARGSRRRRG